ncbi:MAG: recombinase family protein [Planctomycetes bacterium]|nr:recombinase family protein [Planctomycetota bacterium]
MPMGSGKMQFDVLYTRFSTPMQREESCKDQERNIHNGLKKLGIEYPNPLILHDMAESGTKAERALYAEIYEMIRCGQVRLLVVDDQARLSRGDTVMPIIRDLIYHGGRFISIQDHIDTTQKGWELKVKVMEFHNSTTVTELGHRVRRGQAGRVLDGHGSAGDIRFGYLSRFLDPNHAEQSRRGPKPKKEIVVYEVEAKWVVWIFERFGVDRWSIGAIARELNRLKVDKGRKATKPQWRAELVQRILQHTKYVGIWGWGATTTIRSSTGKKKQIPAEDDEVIKVIRPNLRIVPQALWDKAQARLNELHEIYGMKEGQKRRGPRVHHTEVYPASLCGGLLFCELCGARLVVQCSTGAKYLGCPNHRNGTCAMTYRPPMEVAEKALLGFLGEILCSWPEWLETALGSMRTSLTDLARRVPEEVAARRRRLEEVRRMKKNLLGAIEQGTLQVKVVVDRLHELEQEERHLEAEITESEEALKGPVEMPDETLVMAQLNDLAGLVRANNRKVPLLLRKILGRVVVHEMRMPGKKKGYGQLRFQIDGWAILEELLDGKLPHCVIQAGHREACSSPEFQVDLGGPTRMDQWAPKIHEMRRQGTGWLEICRITGLGLGAACTAHKRWHQAQRDGDTKPA